MFYSYDIMVCAVFSFYFNIVIIIISLFFYFPSCSVVERELNVPLPLSKIIKKWNNLLQEYKVSAFDYVNYSVFIWIWKCCLCFYVVVVFRVKECSYARDQSPFFSSFSLRFHAICNVWLCTYTRKHWIIHRQSRKCVFGAFE